MLPKYSLAVMAVLAALVLAAGPADVRADDPRAVRWERHQEARQIQWERWQEAQQIQRDLCGGYPRYSPVGVAAPWAPVGFAPAGIAPATFQQFGPVVGEPQA